MDKDTPQYPSASAVLRARRDALVSRALAEAESVAELLVRDFGAKRVWLFGSLAGGGAFRRGSDIDLAVEGLRSEDLFKAVGRALGATDFSIDLKPIEELPAGWRDEILREGEVLA